MEQKPSPFYRDIKWGEWGFFIVSSGVIAYGAALLIPGATQNTAVAAGIAAAVAAGRAFLQNPKGLPWVEIGQKAVPETALVIEQNREENQNASLGKR